MAELDASELPDLYRLADVVVSVPESDGGASTILEALACGRPIVATNLPSVAELIEDLDPESLVPVGDVTATARAIERVLDRPSSESQERGARGRALVEASADQRRALSEMESLHRRLVRS